MVAFTALPAEGQALVVVVAVAIEALALYVGYGYLEELVGARVVTSIEKL